MLRQSMDNARIRSGKDVSARSVGPAVVRELASDVISFLHAASCLDRQNVSCVVGVAGDEVAVLYPRQDTMASAVGESGVSYAPDPADVAGRIRTGIAALMERCTRSMAATEDGDGRTAPSGGDGTAAVASALSVAMCIINRFMKFQGGGGSGGPSSTDDSGEGKETILSLIDRASGPGGSGRRRGKNHTGGLLPRVLVIQATPDRTEDYNAFMNCTFACMKAGICIDGLFLPDGRQGKSEPASGSAGHPGGTPSLRQDQSSVFLEQAADRTNGIFLSLKSGTAQSCGGLLTVLITAFLPTDDVRSITNVPVQDRVDFRARCFATGQSVDIAYVCNVCLSIFKDMPTDEDGEEGDCPTCGAVMERVKRLKAQNAKKRKDVGGEN